MAPFFNDLRHSFRLLIRSPGLALVSVLTLGLGIGLTATMFGIVNGVLWQPLPFPDADELLYIRRTDVTQSNSQSGVSIHDFLDWRAQQTSFEDLAGWYEGTVNMARGGQSPVRFQGGFMTPNTFEVLRARPQMGRTLVGEDAAPGDEPVIVLGFKAWQEYFDSDPGVLGSSVRVNGTSHTIVGVMPDGFLFPERADVWLPMRQDPVAIPRDGGTWLDVMGRLKQGVSRDEAQLEFSGIAARLAQEYPETNEHIDALIETPGERMLDPEGRFVFFLILAATIAVLLIACFNVANLLLARTSLRTRELALRTSLGAGRGHLVLQLILETFAICLVGGLLGLGFAYLGLGTFTRSIVASEPPYWLRFNIDGMVVLYVTGLVFTTSLLVGLLPGLKASRPDVAGILKEGSRSSSGLRMSRFTKGLVIVEMAFSLGLLFAAGLMMRSMINLSSFEFGVETGGVMTARVGLFETDYPTETDRARFWRDLQVQLSDRPGVTSASLTSNLPLSGSDGFQVEIAGEDPGEEPQRARGKSVAPDYFETFGMELLAGRDFDARDGRSSDRVLIVNQRFADRFLPGQDPLGKQIRPYSDGEDVSEWLTIVGVVSDEWADVRNERPEIVYAPLDQADFRFVSLVARTEGDPASLVPGIREAVAAVDPDIPIYWVRDMDAVFYQQTWVFTIFGGLVLIIGVMALVLSTVGLYAVMSFAVNQRRHEFGIRMALGAQQRRVVTMVVRQGAFQLLAGMGLGMVLAWGLGKGLSLLLFGVPPSDPLTFTLIAVVLLASGLLASGIPAMRATQVDPVQTLRY